MSDEKTTFQIDLDDAEFLKKLLNAKKQLADVGGKETFKDLIENIHKAGDGIGKLGSAEGLGELTKGLMEAGAAVAILGAAWFAVKASLDLVKEAESIKAVNQQFALLSRNAGLVGDDLKKALVDAAGGLVDDTALMEAANKALVSLGTSAAKIPQIMELAQKATAVFGGELTQNFEAINQAIASGNTRQLRSLGIIVNAQDAYDRYARSINVAASSLSDAGKQQALMNEILEKGNKGFQGVDPNIKQVTTAMQQLKVTFQQVQEVAVLFFEKTMGPTVKYWLDVTQKAATATKDWLVRSFGEGAEAAAKNLDYIQDEMQAKARQIIALEKKLDERRANGGPTGELEKQIAAERNTFERLRSQRNDYQKQVTADDKKAEDERASMKENAHPDSAVDPQKQREATAKFERELQQMRNTRTQAAAEMADSEAQLQEATNNKILASAQTLAAQLDQINANKDLTDDQRRQLGEEAELNHQLRLSQIADNAIKDREHMEDNFLRHNKGVMDGIARNAEVTSKRAARSLKAGGDMGGKTFTALASLAGNAFEEIGRSAATGTNQLKAVLLSGLGDIAANYGRVMMLASIWPFNPPVFAAGVALQVLGGALKGFAGGGGGGADAGGGSGGGTPPSVDISDSGGPANPAPQTSEVKPQKSVSVIVQGDFLQTEQTQMRLLDLIRTATDATDFKYQQIR